MLEIRNRVQQDNDFLKLGDTVRVRYKMEETGIDEYYHGKITSLLYEFDTFNGRCHPMVQLNDDEFHTYYVEKCEKYENIKKI